MTAERSQVATRTPGERACTIGERAVTWKQRAPRHPGRWVARVFPLAAVILACAAVSLPAKGPWFVLKNCRLLTHDSNDADSFHVQAGNREYIFRLYFVDAPETDASFPDRVAEQANYFGLTRTQTLQLGDYSRRFSKEKLLQGPFTVRTCMQGALGRSNKERFYAFIETTEGDLGELLVANGMARVHGTAATPVGLSSPQAQRQKLERLEREAKHAKVGAWGASIGRLTARLPKQPSKTGVDSFDAFFHPERLAAPAEVAQISASPAPVRPSPAPLPNTPRRSESERGKIDPNTASLQELISVPGIGPVLAQRIIEARPFTSTEDLRKVKGIGAKTFEKIRPYFISAPALPVLTPRQP